MSQTLLILRPLLAGAAFAVILSGPLFGQRLAAAQTAPAQTAPAQTAPAQTAPPQTTAPQSSDPNYWDGGFKEKAERRRGFTLGLSSGLTLGNTRGSLNDLTKLNDSRFEANSRFGVGATNGFWIGGALSDWLTVGLDIGSLQLFGNGLHAAGTSIALRTEVYPFYSWGGPYRDLGVTAVFGVGLLNAYSGSQRTVLEGGSMGNLAVGTFWEGVRLGHFALGPAVEYRRMFSQSANWDSATLGVRAAFYAGPRLQ